MACPIAFPGIVIVAVRWSIRSANHLGDSTPEPHIPAQRDCRPSSRSSPQVGNKAGIPLPPRIHVLAGFEGRRFCSRLSPRRALGSRLAHSNRIHQPPNSTTAALFCCSRCRRLRRMSSWTRVPADLPTLASHRCSGFPDGGCAACCSDEDHESTTEGHKGKVMILPGISGTLL